MVARRRQSGNSAASGSGVVRIIGGRWRGRKLAFPDADGLRPTPDRVRETLFNWLAADLPGARCLDAFAGSGVIGLEALSRGASHVDFIDLAPAQCRAISAYLQTLEAPGKVFRGDAFDQLSKVSAPLDIAFVDPPYDSAIAVKFLETLIESGKMAGTGVIYLEMAAAQILPELPTSWELYREKIAGQVCYRLLRNSG